MKRLISFIGKGQRLQKKGAETYQTATYQFANGETYTTAIFPEALIRHNQPKISECILIGTPGSAWAALLEEDTHINGQTENIELYEKIDKQFEHENVSGEMLAELERALSRMWDIPVQCHANNAAIDADNVLEILFGYVDLLDSSPNTELLIDITHAFRSMPVILMSALQLWDAILPHTIRPAIIYGEFKQGHNSPVRYLEPIWQGFLFGQGLRQFQEKFEGELLAEEIEDLWPDGAKILKRISLVLQANFVTKLDGTLKELGNKLERLKRAPIGNPKVVTVQKILTALHRQLSRQNDFHNRLRVLAEAFAERKLYGQAITTLQIAVEAYACYLKGEEYGNYENNEPFRRELESRIKNDMGRHSKDLDTLNKLRNSRNQIAHGATLSRDGGMPSEHSLPKQFKKYSDFVARLVAMAAP